MKPLRLILSFFFIMVFMIAEVSARDESLLYEEFTPGKISSFICSLIDSGEYYRAYVELLRLNSFYPSYLNKPVFDVTSSYLFYKSRKYDEILNAGLTDIHNDVIIPVTLFRIDSLIKLNQPDRAESELDRLLVKVSNDKEEFSQYIDKRKFYLSVLGNKKNSPDISHAGDVYEELILFSDEMHAKTKNPYLGMMAGIIPGMGYVYADESGTGIVAMIVIGAGAAITYASGRNGMEPLALISGVITFLFYGGSIAGGYMQTVKYNDRLMETLELRLDRELMPEKDLDEIYFKFGLSSNACR